MNKTGINTNAFKAALAVRGLTQSEVADTAGMSLPAFSNVINGKAAPNFSTIRKISQGIKLTNDEFSQIFYNQKGGE